MEALYHAWMNQLAETMGGVVPSSLKCLAREAVLDKLEKDVVAKRSEYEEALQRYRDFKQRFAK